MNKNTASLFTFRQRKRNVLSSALLGSPRTRPRGPEAGRRWGPSASTNHSGKRRTRTMVIGWDLSGQTPKAQEDPIPNKPNFGPGKRVWAWLGETHSVLPVGVFNEWKGRKEEHVLSLHKKQNKAFELFNWTLTASLPGRDCCYYFTGKEILAQRVWIIHLGSYSSFASTLISLVSGATWHNLLMTHPNSPWKEHSRFYCPGFLLLLLFKSHV